MKVKNPVSQNIDIFIYIFFFYLIVNQICGERNGDFFFLGHIAQPYKDISLSATNVNNITKLNVFI